MSDRTKDGDSKKDKEETSVKTIAKIPSNVESPKSESDSPIRTKMKDIKKLEAPKSAGSSYGNVFNLFRTSEKKGDDTKAKSAYGNVIIKHATDKKPPLRSESQISTVSTSPKPKTKEFIEAEEVLQKKNMKLLKNIGSGNYAEVYTALRVDKQRVIAAKVIDLTKASNNYRIKFLPREMQILRKINHKNIIKVYEIMQSSNKIFILMEYAPNGTVGDFIRKHGAIPEDICLPMFIGVLEGLHYMHTYSIAHRDLKVENILLDKNYIPKLADFSHSKEVIQSHYDITLSLTFCGSLPYFPPEIMRRKPYDPLKADIWSLGICLYVMLCDGLPFSLNDESHMLKCQLRKDWKFKARVENKLSPESKDIVRRMLEPMVEKRYSTATLFTHPWIRNRQKSH